VPKNHTTTSTADKCAAVTAQIIEQLYAGVAPWVRPWTTTGVSDMPTNFATQRTYRGASILNLWMAQTASGYDTAEWMTFKQAIDLGACVRKGEHGTPVFFVSALEREEPNAKGELVERHIRFWKSFTVFNIAQVEGLPERLPVPPRPEIERLASVDAYLAAVGATVRLGGDRAFYSPSTDSITLPLPEQFESVSAFYATSCHEHAHNAEPRVMPRRSNFPRESQADRHAIRHNQRASRKSRNPRGAKKSGLWDDRRHSRISSQSRGGIRNL
jgi:antirestriction protein ArdC